MTPTTGIKEDEHNNFVDIMNKRMKGDIKCTLTRLKD